MRGAKLSCQNVVSTDAAVISRDDGPWMNSIFLEKTARWRSSNICKNMSHGDFWISLVGNWKPTEVLMTLNLGHKSISDTWYVTLWYNWIGYHSQVSLYLLVEIPEPVKVYICQEFQPFAFIWLNFPSHLQLISFTKVSWTAPPKVCEGSLRPEVTKGLCKYMTRPVWKNYAICFGIAQKVLTLKLENSRTDLNVGWRKHTLCHLKMVQNPHSSHARACDQKLLPDFLKPWNRETFGIFRAWVSPSCS